MNGQKQLVVSHAPFWHNGNRMSVRNYHIMLAAAPAAVMGVIRYGGSALGVLALSIALAMVWELLMNLVTKRPISIGDGNAALIGLLFAMLMPPSAPWWMIATGTFVAVIVGKQIFGGIGGNPFNPVLVGVAILAISWKAYMDFDISLVPYSLDYSMAYPLASLKNFGAASVSGLSAGDLLMGRQTGGVGAIFGLGLIIGGLYLIVRGIIRWEISLSFLVGVAVTAWLFTVFGESGKFAGPMIHLLTGYTLIGAFFLATEDSSSPVNLVPMILFGLMAGVMAVLIRNIGAYVDGVVLAILLMNVANPLLDLIRPKELGKVKENA